MSSRSRSPASPAFRKALMATALASLAALTACTSTGGARPTTPTYSGRERPDPTRPPRPGEPLPNDSVGVQNPNAENRNAYMPRHLDGQRREDIKRIAVLLPFNSPDAEVKKLSTGLFNAIQLALFDSGRTDVLLMPRDATGDADAAARAANDAIKDGAVAVIGPLFSQHVASVAAQAAPVRAPVFSFSTDVTAINQGAYLMSLTPATEVKRIVEWASKQGVNRFAMFAPRSAYGQAVEGALRAEAQKQGAVIIGVEFYNPGDTSPQAEAKRLAEILKSEAKAAPGKVAVLIPERGIQLRQVAPLLPLLDVNPRQVKFLGTGAWNDPEVWREPALHGGAFPAPDPASAAQFEARYKAVYGEAPPRLSSFGYDAGALISALAHDDRLDGATLQRSDGFMGVNGLFRFASDGSVERGLAVMQVGSSGASIVSPAITAFIPGS